MPSCDQRGGPEAGRGRDGGPWAGPWSWEFRKKSQGHGTLPPFVHCTPLAGGEAAR